MARVLVLTGCNNVVWPVHNVTVRSKRAWCERQGYDFLDLRQWNASTLCWDRFYAVERELGHYDAVLHLDADAVITNPSIGVESLIDESHSCFVSRDWNHADDVDPAHHFSTGNFIFRNTPAAALIFETLRSIQRQRITPHEQDAMRLIARDRLSGAPGILVCEGTRLNAVPRDFHPNSGNVWTPECLLAHLTGASNEKLLMWLASREYF